MTWAETYTNTPGSVENYLQWTGGLQAGNRGNPATRESVAAVTITGTEEVMLNLSHIVATIKDKAVHELGLCCEDILSASKKEVPWDSTHLQQTGTVEPASNTEVGGQDAFIIGYNTPYAARQHEDMTFHHPKPGTKAKYLEDPAMRIAPTIAATIANALRGELGG
jgi:hypothetical protein